jgi:hypothetical protein
VFRIGAAGERSFVGSSALLLIVNSSANDTLGYQLDERWRDQGFGTPAGEFLVSFRLRVLGQRRVRADFRSSASFGARRINGVISALGASRVISCSSGSRVKSRRSIET